MQTLILIVGVLLGYEILAALTRIRLPESRSTEYEKARLNRIRILNQCGDE